jgi:hypothetical protein
MARNGNVNVKDVALETDVSVGKADGTGDHAARPDVAEERQLDEISEQVNTLRRQLRENTEGESNAERVSAT